MAFLFFEYDLFFSLFFGKPRAGFSLEIGWSQGRVQIETKAKLGVFSVGGVVFVQGGFGEDNWIEFSKFESSFGAIEVLLVVLFLRVLVGVEDVGQISFFV